MSKKEEVVSMASKTVSVPKEEKKEAQIYLGPSFKGVIEGMVYNNGLPPALEEAAKKMPAIRELVVPINRAAEAMRELTKPDSAMRRFYQRAWNYGKGE